MQSSRVHRQLALTVRNMTAVTDFRKDAEMPSNNSGSVPTLAGFKLIKNLKDILATISIQTYQCFLVPTVAFN